jgi:hypothetical protein
LKRTGKQEVYDYFQSSHSDSINDAINELGKENYSVEELQADEDQIPQ